MKNKGKTESLKQILPKVFEDLEKKKVLQNLEEVWGSTIDSRAIKHTKIANFKKGVLTVTVNSSIWIYELTLKKSEFLKRLRRKKFFNDLKDIRFRIGEF